MKFNEFLDKLKSKYGEELFKEYTIPDQSDTFDYSKPFKYIHNVCGHEDTMMPSYFLINGCRCKYCAKKKRLRKSTYTIDNLKEDVYKIFGDKYKITSTTISKKTDTVKYFCQFCNEEHETTAKNLLRGHGCKKEGYARAAALMAGKPKPHTNIKSLEQLKRDVLNAIGPDYEVIDGTYTKSTEYFEIKHKVCQRQYSVKSCNIITHHTGCPYCSNKNYSEKQDEVMEYIRSIYPSEINKGKKFKTSIGIREADIEIPDKKIIIEFDGLYWHSDDKIDRDYHIDKTNAFKELGYRTVHIFEDEWDYKKDIVKTKLANIIGCSSNDKIYARKCKVEKINTKQKDDFLEKYHIQGKDSAKIKYGLFYNDELVAVMTFTKPRAALRQNKNADGEYELSRFASSKNVVGGFSKLLKHIIKNHPEIKSIYTFADIRWSSYDKNVYSKNGFKLDHISKPSYWYIPKNKNYREYRFKYRKSMLKKLFPEYYDKSLTEIEIMKKAGYKVIWDCGNLVYKMKI